LIDSIWAHNLLHFLEESRGEWEGFVGRDARLFKSGDCLACFGRVASNKVARREKWMSVCTINLDESIEVETRLEVDERGSFESGVIEVLLMNANPASFRATPVEKRRF
jgi:hypothetical protein